MSAMSQLRLARLPSSKHIHNLLNSKDAPLERRVCSVLLLAVDTSRADVRSPTVLVHAGTQL